VVLLFTECYDKTLKNCVENDCQEKGTERIFTTRKLLVSRTNAQQIIGTLPEHNRGYRLDSLSLRRFKIGTTAYTAYGQVFLAYRNLIDQTILSLDASLAKSYTLYESVLSEEYNGSDPFLLPGMNLQTIRNNYLANHPFAIQYLYDFLCDIIEAYQEFREVAFGFDAMCCPPVDAFPKHLFIGPLPPDPACEPSYFRTGYMHTSKREGQDLLELKLKHLHRKIIQLILNFNLPSVDAIRVTPSRYGDVPFSRSAIPFYYTITAGGSLLSAWNPELTRRCRSDENLSYFAGSYSSKAFVTSPLDFDLSEHNFYRIEGHIGQDYEVALKTVLGIRREESLDFDVVAIKLGVDGSNIEIDDMRCSFQDLQILYESWARELECQFTGAVGLLTGYNFRQVISSDTDEQSFRGLVRERTGNLYKLRSAYGATYEQVSDRVIQSIRTEERTYGRYIRDNVVFNGRTADQYFQEVEAAMREGESIENLNQTDYTLAVEGPVKTVLLLIQMAELIAESVDNVDIDQLVQVEQNLRQLITSYASAVAQYQTSASMVRIDQGRIQSLLWLLDQVCALQQLITLLEEIERRKLELQRLNLFAGFVEKHPGVKHRGGVPKGGTFVMVYHEESQLQEEDVPVDGFVFRGRVLAPNGAFLPGADIYSPQGGVRATSGANGTFTIVLPSLPATLIISFTGFPVGQYSVSSADSRRSFRLGVPDDQQASLVPANRSVVLDFFLPYQCCSDCPSVTYVFEEPSPELGLDQTTFCVPFDGDAPTFRVVPEDGEIAGPGVSQNDAGAFIFIPNDVALNGNLFRMVNFTLNGREMPLSVSVYASPVPDFSFEIGFIDPANNSTQVTFTNNSQNRQSSIWDFGDGSSPIEFDGQTIDYQFFLNDETTFQVTLTVSNGPCTQSIDQEVLIDVPVVDPELLFDFDEFCIPANVGPSDLQVTPVPANGIVTGPGISGQVGGPWFFDPNAVQFGSAGQIEVTFNVNGVPMPNTVNLYRHPQPALTVIVPSFNSTDGETVEVTFVNGTPHYTDANWNYGDGTTSTELAGTHTKEYPIGEVLQFTVTLSVFNVIDSCAETITRIVTIPTPSAEIQERNERTQICNGGETIFIDVTPANGTLVSSPDLPLLQVDGNSWSFIADDSVTPGTYQFQYNPPVGAAVDMTLDIQEAFDVQVFVVAEEQVSNGLLIGFRAFPEDADTYSWIFNLNSPSSPPIFRGPFPSSDHPEIIPPETSFVYFTLEVRMGDCTVIFGPYEVSVDALFQSGQLNFPIVGGGGNFQPGGDFPVFEWPQTGGGLVVDRGGIITVGTGVDLGSFSVARFNQDVNVINELPNDDAVTSSRPAMRILDDTREMLNGITNTLVQPTQFTGLKAGTKDDEIAKQTRTMVMETARAILSEGREGQARNTKMQTIMLKLLAIQIGQFVNLNTVKEDDFIANSEIGKTFATLEAQLMQLKEGGVNINTGGVFVRTLKDNLKGAQPKLNRQVQTLIERIEA
ncbi:MAG: hypothetical protein AAFV80_07840, partial [Bacteroidota bacterium]